MITTDGSHPFLGRSTSGHAIRRFDWAAGPLGPTGSWSHSLQTMVGAILATRISNLDTTGQ
ncbi:MAG: hypothetical protein SXG53_10755 [Pseudomonadota bacterium]|nr:hypothetical protein [Pseudomonadota bacterium]